MAMTKKPLSSLWEVGGGDCSVVVSVRYRMTKEASEVSLAPPRSNDPFDIVVNDRLYMIEITTSLDVKLSAGWLFSDSVELIRSGGSEFEIQYVCFDVCIRNIVC